MAAIVALLLWNLKVACRVMAEFPNNPLIVGFIEVNANKTLQQLHNMILTVMQKRLSVWSV